MMNFAPLLINPLLLLTMLEESATGPFDDLGKLVLVGVSAAIVFAVGFTFVRFRLRDKKPPTSNFISISSPVEKDS